MYNLDEEKNTMKASDIRGPKLSEKTKPIQKVILPDWAFEKADAFIKGQSKDRSGMDALEAWISTATSEEIEEMFSKARKAGWYYGQHQVFSLMVLFKAN